MKLQTVLLAACMGGMVLGAGAARAESCGESYSVRAGDWLSRIAQRCNVSPEAIVALNPGLDPDAIEVGQKIRLSDLHPVLDLERVPLRAMPPAPPQKGKVEFSGEIIRDAGACLFVRDPAGRLYSFASGDSALKIGMAVSVRGEVVGNWFCDSGAEVLVDAVEAAPAQVATLDSETL